MEGGNYHHNKNRAGKWRENPLPFKSELVQVDFKSTSIRWVFSECLNLLSVILPFAFGTSTNQLNKQHLSMVFHCLINYLVRYNWASSHESPVACQW